MLARQLPTNSGTSKTIASAIRTPVTLHHPSEGRRQERDAGGDERNDDVLGHAAQFQARDEGFDRTHPDSEQNRDREVRSAHDSVARLADKRVDQCRKERETDRQLDGRARLERGEVRAAMVEDHHLVDHRQFEMGRWIVDRHPCRLDLHHDEERDEARQPHGREHAVGRT